MLTMGYVARAERTGACARLVFVDSVAVGRVSVSITDPNPNFLRHGLSVLALMRVLVGSGVVGRVTVAIAMGWVLGAITDP